ncbi:MULTISPECIES: DUF885 family protein [Asticcacaulis]|uniref:DUF885 domain-containing protein n=1 Tax=Asticcacaulis TaxID=76890 RepID=UPI001AE80567|nr:MULTISPECIES: DUF885 family protein [Asticcacaulis]MBP2161770.1 uncharacterized protein (DUF885 family) [Asticcacaulis solisilvae]MDR6802816.1 uncharacterized protein (DUF885 family) [Asticcacaulis sp. BE141]
MVDRRYVVGALAALFGSVAAEALAAPKKKKKAAASKKKSSSKSKKSSKKSTKGKKAAPKKVEAPKPPPPPPVPAVTAPEVAAQLNNAYDLILREWFTASPVQATSAGLDKGQFAVAKTKLDDRSEASKASNLARLRRAVQTLRAIDRNDLSAADRLNYDSVLWDNENQLALAQGFAYGDYGVFAGGFAAPYVVSQLTGAYQFVPDFLATQHEIANKADAESYLMRLSDFARAVDQENERIRADAGRGVIPPDFVLKKAMQQLIALRDTDPAYSPVVTALDSKTQALGIAGTWRDDASARLTGPVREALTRQIDILSGLAGQAKHDAGVRNQPNGEAYYAQCVKLSTSTDDSAKEVHAIGLDQVARLSAELDSRLRALGMTQGTPGERMHAMYTDPKYLYPNTDDGKAKLLNDLNGLVHKVEARLPSYFGVLPKSKVSIRRVPVATEAGAPGGYYMPGSIDGSRAGAYYINLRDTGNNPSWTLPTLTCHEAIPGHHMQLTIQNEAQGIPTLRKLLAFNANVEGWALYSEQLASEMGIYNDDAPGRIGYLHDALFRAVRLVVDTGMHNLGWSREQAITYMRDAMGDSESAVTAEIERYVVWPGQALGYMMGKITWLRLRDAQKRKQGGAFDIKAFHDTGMLAGSVPLSVLEQLYKDKGLI